MIVTVTANPAIDRLLTLDEPLVRGVVGRTGAPVDQPGGKGVNVARVVAAAGHEVAAIFPAPAHDSFVTAVEATGLAHVAVPTRSRVRVNLTLAEADGTTTKLNAPGAELSADELDRLTRSIVESSAGAAWVVLSGSLPPGVPDDWYAVLTRTLRAGGARVAVDASGAPLLATLGACLLYTSPSPRDCRWYLVCRLLLEKKKHTATWAVMGGVFIRISGHDVCWDHITISAFE
ncbi:PfkB family carbohydrate kinase [Aeromicrobium fastidiosum]|uniref:1-phosphofructokinase family hexose kinase n=1 Tax=Aeromicrobium fastidiosum TaxID=52699 RepID=UPI0020231E33|nr:PfkB family carbohydrate kinase [Aeromicrobium fastidiosum]MCL8253341.1 PfkB family carbohydrate kinase [Aeromicrobium fastidiosum]